MNFQAGQATQFLRLDISIIHPIFLRIIIITPVVILEIIHRITWIIVEICKSHSSSGLTYFPLHHFCKFNYLCEVGGVVFVYCIKYYHIMTTFSNIDLNISYQYYFILCQCFRHGFKKGFLLINFIQVLSMSLIYLWT